MEYIQTTQKLLKNISIKKNTTSSKIHLGFLDIDSGVIKKIL